MQVNLAADDIRRRLQLSSDLQEWTDATGDFELVSLVNMGDGTAILQYESVSLLGSTPREFVRVHFSKD